jgi:lysyl-tRNA synthetase class II
MILTLLGGCDIEPITPVESAPSASTQTEPTEESQPTHIPDDPAPTGIEKIAESGRLTRDELEGYNSCRAIIDYAYKKLIRRNIVGPTILYNYPAFLKTLARRNDDDARVTDVFQVVVNGAEILNAYSELVDPIEQRKALVSQLKDKEMGDDETMDVDEDFLLAMEHGMPPISGLGFGIDRFIMMIFDLPNIRDSILFPMTKPIEDNSKDIEE